MGSVSREQLRQEVDQLDSAYIELAYRVLRQFPHRFEPDREAKRPPPPSSFSRRWRGRLADRHLSREELRADPKLAFLAERYQL